MQYPSIGRLFALKTSYFPSGLKSDGKSLTSMDIALLLMMKCDKHLGLPIICLPSHNIIPTREVSKIKISSCSCEGMTWRSFNACSSFVFALILWFFCVGSLLGTFVFCTICSVDLCNEVPRNYRYLRFYTLLMPFSLTPEQTVKPFIIISGFIGLG